MGSSVNGLVDQRRDIRFPTSFRAAVLWGGRMCPVEVVDIANHGVRLSGPDLPAVSTVIQVGAHGLDERAQVIWRANQHCGVRFVHRISAMGVVRANCFPVRPGRALLDGPRALPAWLKEDLLIDPSVDMEASRHPPQVAAPAMQGRH